MHQSAFLVALHNRTKQSARERRVVAGYDDSITAEPWANPNGGRSG